ncbi:MAG: hypothetical protein AAF222_04175 [Pseudomonadota bacterium]
MSDTAVPVLITVLSGTFTNQAAAFFVLRTEAAKLGIELLPTQTDIIREAPEVRLAHYFRPAIVARIEEAQQSDDTIALLFPSLLTARPAYPSDDSAFRLIGRFAGRLGEPS